MFGSELGMSLTDGFFNITIEVVFAAGEDVMDAEDASDGGGGKAEDAQDTGQLVEASGGGTGFDQTAGEDVDEGNLIDQAFEVSGFDAGEVAFFDAPSVGAVFKGIGVTEGCAEVAKVVAADPPASLLTNYRYTSGKTHGVRVQCSRCPLETLLGGGFVILPE